MANVLIWGLTEKFGGVERYVLDRMPLFLSKYDEIYFGFSEGIDTDIQIQWSDLLNNSHIHICSFPHLSRPCLYYKKIVEFIRANKVDAVYCNIGFANALLYEAVKIGGSKLIVHAHNTRIDVNSTKKRVALNIYHYISRALFDHVIDERYACSTEAGQWVFSKENFKLKKNAIDLTAYLYDPAIRAEVRKQLNIKPDTIVIGHVGRFSYQKNHEYLIRLFSYFVQKQPDSMLMLIGTGDNFNKIQHLAENMNLTSKVLFLGLRNHVNKLMQAMDCFVLPSRFEGLGIVGIEAQAASLPCFFADTITKEIAVTSNAHFFSIKENAENVATCIYKYMTKHAGARRRNRDELIKAGYDLQEELRQEKINV